MSARAPGRRTVIATAIGLLGLWGLSWAMSSLELGGFALGIALVIAAIKASLVLMIFMELLRLSASARLVAALSVAMLALMLGLVIADVYARGLQGGAL
jgi:cytochrome c oxidase subunit 4